MNIATACFTPKTCRWRKSPRPVGTPCYVYSTATLERHYTVFSQAFKDVDSLVCYAMKANSNQAVLKVLGRLGAGIDVVSEGELRRGAGRRHPASRIMFSGVGKTVREMDLALETGIYCFNVESEPELELLNARAVKAGKRAPVSFRINRMWMPRLMPRSRPARRKTSSAFPTTGPRRLCPRRRPAGD